MRRATGEMVSSPVARHTARRDSYFFTTKFTVSRFSGIAEWSP